MLGNENKIFGSGIIEQVRPFVRVPDRGCEVCNEVIVDNILSVCL